jgi:hypothetical protein
VAGAIDQRVLPSDQVKRHERADRSVGIVAGPSRRLIALDLNVPV